MKLLQPQIVKFNKNEELDEKIRNKYFIYYTISGLFDNQNAIRAIYVDMNSMDKLHIFIQNIQNTDISLLFTGDNDFILGEDYYLNESLYLSNNIIGTTIGELVYLPNYMTFDGVNTKYFDEVNNYNTLLEYFKTKNEYSNLTFDEEFLKDFYVNFANLIIELSTYVPTDNNDIIYKQVLYYFSNFQTDDVFLGMSLMFNTLFGTIQNTQTNCGCPNKTVNDTICSTSCVDYYKQAMQEYVVRMFGDYTFYQKWFYIIDEETNLTQINTFLVERLKTFITEFLSLDLNISTTKSDATNCSCPTINNFDDSCNRGILKNMITILEFIENNEIEENSNRIKVYGEEFGKIYSKLIF
jgi:hypothetical protein